MKLLVHKVTTKIMNFLSIELINIHINNDLLIGSCLTTLFSNICYTSWDNRKVMKWPRPIFGYCPSVFMEKLRIMKTLSQECQAPRQGSGSPGYEEEAITTRKKQQ